MADFWFDKDAYFQNKLKAEGGKYDELTLRAAFIAAGYNPDDADSMQSHFTAYGNAEGVSPNQYFDTESYLYYKAVQMHSQDGTQLYFKDITPQMLETLRLQIQDAGLTPWTHYLRYGSWEEQLSTNETRYLNPSTKFDTNQYLADKLALLQAAEPDAAWTLQGLVDALNRDGLNPLTHFMQYGVNEGLTAKATAEGVPGKTVNLTAADDSLYGTTSDDLFNATVGRLNDGDYVDGRIGFDTLKAVLNQDNAATQPTLMGVEKVIFQAQQQTVVSGDNNPGNNAYAVDIDAGNIQGAYTTDADDIQGAGKQEGLRYLQNANSRADLNVEDVRSDSNLMTTIWSDSDPGAVDFGVFFDPQHLKAADQQVSGTLNLRLMDVRNADPATTPALTPYPLFDNPFDSFSFNLNGQNYKLDLAATGFALKGASATYQTLLDAFQAAIEAEGLTGIVTATFGTTFIGRTTDGNVDYESDDIGQIILLHSNSGALEAPTDDPNTGWGVSTGNVPALGGIVWSAVGDRAEDCPLIQTTVQLDNVGRVQWYDASDCLPSDEEYGSAAGNLVIGSMATRGGVERFDVSVDRGSWLNSLASTNNALRMVTVVNADTNGDGINGNVTAQSNNPPTGASLSGQLYIGATQEESNSMFAWQDAPKLLGTNGLVDVKYFDASGEEHDGNAFTGDLNIGAELTAASYDKYLKDVDGVDNMAANYAPDGAFAYNLGLGSDTLNMKVNGEIAADQDFRLNISANDGNDFINFAFADTTDYQNENIRDGLLNPGNPGHERVVIDGGAGNDIIKFWGNGAVVANGGAGDDVIFVSQVPDSSVSHATGANAHNAVWVLNTDTVDGAMPLDKVIYWDSINGAQPLNNNVNAGPAVFTYTVAATGGTTAIAAGAELAVSINFLGVTGTASLGTVSNTAGTYSLTAEQINEAIAKAVADSPTLKHVLAVKDGAGHSLMIESLINHWTDTSSLSIGFTQKIGTAAATAITQTDFNTALGDAYVDALAAGTAYAYDLLPLGVANQTHQGDAASGAEYTIRGIDDNVTTLGTQGYAGLMIDGVMYSAHGNPVDLSSGDAGIIESLQTATDANGNLLTDKYQLNGGADANTGVISITAREAGYAEKVDVQLYVIDFVNNIVDGNGTLNVDGYTALNRTDSNNIVEGGAGNDVIVLAASDDDDNFDIVRLSGAFGDDTIFNFQGDIAGDRSAGIDGFDVTALLKVEDIDIATTSTQSEPVGGQLYNLTLTGAGVANGVTVVDNATYQTTANGGGNYASGFTVADLVAHYAATGAGNNTTAFGSSTTNGDTSLYFLEDDTNALLGTKYTVFQVVEDSAGALTAAEVTLLGTITLENTASGHGDIVNTDFYFFA